MPRGPWRSLRTALTCEMCGKEIEAHVTHYVHVSGWEKQRSAGGGNALALRAVSTPTRALCLGCLERKKLGTEGQESLL